MNWELYKRKPKPAEDESPLGTLGRNAIGIGAEAIEGLVGLPGNIQRSIKGLGKIPEDQKNKINMQASEHAQQGLTPEQFSNYENAVSDVKNRGGNIGFNLPTSGDIRKNVSEPVSKALGAPEGYLEPQGYGEQRVRNITGKTIPAVASNLLTGGAAGIGNALGAATAGEVAKEGVRVVGGGETAQGIADTLGMVGWNLWGTRSKLEKVAKDGFDTQERIAKEQDLKGPPNPPGGGGGAILKNVESQRDNLLKPSNDVPDDVKNFMKDRYDAVLSGIKSKETPNKRASSLSSAYPTAGKATSPESLPFGAGLKTKTSLEQLPVSDAVNMLRKVNAWFKNPDTPKGAIPYLKKLNGAINGFIEANGSKSPEFIEAFKESNELWKAMEEGVGFAEKLQNKLPKFKNQTFQKVVEGGLMPAAYAAGSGALYALGGINGLIGVAAAGLSARELYKMQQLISKSPRAAAVYKDMFTQLAKKNIPIVVARAEQLDSMLNKL